MTKVFAGTAIVCGLLASGPTASAQAPINGPELATQLAIHRIAAGIVTPASEVGSRRLVEIDRTPSEADIKAFRITLPSLAQRLVDAGSGFRMTVSNVAHIRKEREPGDVQAALSRVVSVDEARTMTLTASVYRLVLGAMAGRAPNGIVGRRTPEACRLDRGMSLRLLKFSGGSVDDYAICRSS